MNIWNISSKRCLKQGLQTTSYSTHHQFTIITLANYVVNTVNSIRKMSQYFSGHVMNPMRCSSRMELHKNQIIMDNLPTLQQLSLIPSL